jgi:cellulose synthase/poly-beta-1,6-N-acetylglucosamine synthase-like glycosyltransferase
MTAIVFWITVGLIFYAYVGYILAILLLSVIIRNPVRVDEGFEPTVTLIITAYNEEKDIAKKLENSLNQDYPHNRFEILVASDGSTDGTDQIVADYSKKNAIIKLARVEGRVGKTETQNQAVQAAKGEIIVFSDATTDYRNDAIRKIVRNYADPTVGAVSGRYLYITEKNTAMGAPTILFWNYENLIKSCQTRIRTITGCCGCIYSVRKALYEPLRRDIISDLVEPLKILEKGHRIAFEPEAIAYETTTERSSEELGMRIRVITRGMHGLLHMKTLLNPLKYGFVSFQLLSHKVLRWLIPVMMIALMGSNLFLLGHWFYNLTFFLQAGLYFLAAVGWALDRYGIKNRLTSMPLYFLVINIACLFGIFNVVKGERKSVWETVRNA